MMLPYKEFGNTSGLLSSSLWKGMDARGKSKSGIIDAEGTTAARQKLRSSGFFPVSIKETQELLKKKTSRSLNLSRYFSRVKPAEIAMEIGVEENTVHAHKSRIEKKLFQEIQHLKQELD